MNEQPGPKASAPASDPLAGEVFEVFARRKPEEPLHHIGYVNAPDAELAGVYARSIYDEWDWIEMVVVPRAAITTVIEM
jgi:1,2-phenylacetyl-CoA epoxidase PaaB subunit